LKLKGHDVLVAYDGATGLRMARQFHPEIVICDIGLPGLDGYEVARTLKSSAGLDGSFLIALSGYARPEDVERSYAAGYDRHIAKPPNPEELDRIFSATI
jgi:CheY-like chemotaxis protein